MRVSGLRVTPVHDRREFMRNDFRFLKPGAIFRGSVRARGAKVSLQLRRTRSESILRLCAAPISVSDSRSPSPPVSFRSARTPGTPGTPPRFLGARDWSWEPTRNAEDTSVARTGHIPGYAGHVPRLQHVAGRSFMRATRRALCKSVAHLSVTDSIPVGPHEVSVHKIAPDGVISVHDGHIPGYAAHMTGRRDADPGHRFSETTAALLTVSGRAAGATSLRKMARRALNQASMNIARGCAEHVPM